MNQPSIYYLTTYPLRVLEKLEPNSADWEQLEGYKDFTLTPMDNLV